MIMPAVKLGGDGSEMADQNQPKGYFIPHIHLVQETKN